MRSKEKAVSNHKRRAKGFTIVELAIVFIVIGLMVGAVIAGARMITNSRLAATYIRTQTIATALKSFTDKYRALPGDMPTATTRLAHCDNDPAGSCGNGNGNHEIGPGGLPIFTSHAGANYNENRLFWYHLTAADLMIHEIDLDAPVATPTWNLTNPETPAGGGFTVITMTGDTDDLPNDPLNGIYLVWQRNPTGDASTAANVVVSPRDAAYIDEKFDDGQPLTGTVRARGANAGLAADACRASTTAYTSTADAACYMYFKIREVSGL